MQRNTFKGYLPEIDKQASSRNPNYPFAPNANRISFCKFLGELLGLADPATREPERFFFVQTTLAQFRNGIAQMRLQFAPVIGREV